MQEILHFLLVFLVSCAGNAKWQRYTKMSSKERENIEAGVK